MEVDPAKLPRRKTPIDLNKIYLKAVWFLDPLGTKFFCVGIFQDRGLELGVLFKDKKSYVYWSLDVFNQMAEFFGLVTGVLDSKKRHHYKIDSGEDIKVQSTFGKRTIILYDGLNSVSLSRDEWLLFLKANSCGVRYIQKLFYLEGIIKQYILDVLSSDEDFVDPPPFLPARLVDPLFDEVRLYNGGG